MFDVSWAPTYIREKHIEKYKEIAGSRYKVNQDLMRTLDPVKDAGAIHRLNIEQPENWRFVVWEHTADSQQRGLTEIHLCSL